MCCVVVCVTVTGTFTCTLKFIVKDCDPNTGETDDEGYEDEYVVSAAQHPSPVVKKQKEIYTQSQ